MISGDTPALPNRIAGGPAVCKKKLTEKWIQPDTSAPPNRIVAVPPGLKVMEHREYGNVTEQQDS